MKHIKSTLAIFTSLLLLIILSGIFLGLNHPTNKPLFMSSFFEARIIINAITAILLLILLSDYFKIYFETKAKFSLGLIIIATALLLQAMISNPLIPLIFGFKGIGSGFFGLISNTFNLIAVIVLLWLSKE